MFLEREGITKMVFLSFQAQVNKTNKCFCNPM